MYGWLYPLTCPCDQAAKAWIEKRLCWLDEHFERSAFAGGPVILPTQEFFPDRFDGSYDSADRLFERVCRYMDIDHASVRLSFTAQTYGLQFVTEGGQRLSSGSGGTYRRRARHVITIDRAEFLDPAGLVGTMAHELAHARLFGETDITADSFDNELLTDLTVVHMGLGIFSANTPRNWDGDYSKWPGTSLLKPGYMTPPMFGWALAHLAWSRREDKPHWARFLRGEPRTNLKHGLRFLNKTGQTSYSRM